MRRVLLYKKRTACHTDYRAKNRYGRRYLVYASDSFMTIIAR